MKTLAIVSGLLIIGMLILVSTAATLSADDAVRIEPTELKAKLGQPGLSVIDVRIASEWKKSSQKITGAVREDPHNVSSWADKYSKDQILVLYCS